MRFNVFTSDILTRHSRKSTLVTAVFQSGELVRARPWFKSQCLLGKRLKQEQANTRRETEPQDLGTKERGDEVKVEWGGETPETDKELQKHCKQEDEVQVRRENTPQKPRNHTENTHNVFTTDPESVYSRIKLYFHSSVELFSFKSLQKLTCVECFFLNWWFISSVSLMSRLVALQHQANRKSKVQGFISLPDLIKYKWYL